MNPSYLVVEDVVLEDDQLMVWVVGGSVAHDLYSVQAVVNGGEKQRCRLILRFIFRLRLTLESLLLFGLFPAGGTQLPLGDFVPIHSILVYLGVTFHI